MSRPYILISNDDGVQARGINFLIETLRPIADLLVVAPDSPRSGFGCSITSAAPIHYKKLHEEPGLTVCSCTGTPVDCVKLALNLLIDRRPDLIIGGINHGDNSSVNTHYSGTMGVATEGALQGYPSVAFSLCDHREDADFTPLASYIVDLVFKSIALGMPSFTCLNVNFPKANKFKGGAHLPHGTQPLATRTGTPKASLRRRLFLAGGRLRGTGAGSHRHRPLGLGTRICGHHADQPRRDRLRTAECFEADFLKQIHKA